MAFVEKVEHVIIPAAHEAEIILAEDIGEEEESKKNADEWR